MFIISGKGDYSILTKYPKNAFQEYELYLKTSDDCDVNKFNNLPNHIKICSVHQPTKIKLNGELQNFNITSTGEVGEESIKSLNKTIDFAKQCNIKKIVLHESMFNSVTSNKQESIKLFKQRVSKYLSSDFMICIETNVMWFDYCRQHKTLLTKIEDFKEIKKLLGKDFHITLDIEHLSYTYLFEEFLKENIDYNFDNINAEEFAEDFKLFAKQNSSKLDVAFKHALELFITTFKNDIEHIHINGTDYFNYYYPNNFSFFIGEHLPIKYVSEETEDRFDYNFIFNALKMLPVNKNINIV
ncbi:hypothetical protein HN777_02755, partial [Candidatus Woesearchaeota archaeon]|nr:hypothetical protein [Candidatus Woesearchaeota archaeon]